MKTLACSGCGEIKSTSEFRERRDRKRGFSYKCRLCLNAYVRSRKFEPKTDGEKVCTKCRQTKPLLEFEVARKNKDGRFCHCKTCRHEYKMQRLNTVPETRIIENLRRRTRAFMKGNNKSYSTLSLLGCSAKKLRLYLESLFKEGMSWDNYGDWHIDHIQPFDKFDCTNPEHQKIVCHYTNLQPMWAKDNLSKGSK